MQKQKLIIPCSILIAFNFSNSNAQFTFNFIIFITFFFSICCVNTPLGRKMFEIEREIYARDQDFCSRQRKIRDREVRDKEIKIAYRVRKCPRDQVFCSRQREVRDRGQSRQRESTVFIYLYRLHQLSCIISMMA